MLLKYEFWSFLGCCETQIRDIFYWHSDKDLLPRSEFIPLFGHIKMVAGAILLIIPLCLEKDTLSSLLWHITAVSDLTQKYIRIHLLIAHWIKQRQKSYIGEHSSEKDTSLPPLFLVFQFFYFLSPSLINRSLWSLLLYKYYLLYFYFHVHTSHSYRWVSLVLRILPLLGGRTDHRFSRLSCMVKFKMATHVVMTSQPLNRVRATIA